MTVVDSCLPARLVCTQHFRTATINLNISQNIDRKDGLEEFPLLPTLSTQISANNSCNGDSGDMAFHERTDAYSTKPYLDGSTAVAMPSWPRGTRPEYGITFQCSDMLMLLPLLKRHDLIE
jgi:hypothetical protein